MIEQPSGSHPPSEQSVARVEPTAIPVAEGARSRPIANGQAACLDLQRTGTRIGWCLAVLGFIAGFERVIVLWIDGNATNVEWAHAWVGAVFALIVYALAGLGVVALARMTGAAIREYLDRVSQLSEELLSLAARFVAGVDQIAQLLGDGGAATRQAEQSSADRLLAQIQQATGESQWARAESLLTAFATEFPDDSRHAVQSGELETARDRANRQHLAKLEAAREVNDPEGVLESYLKVVASLKDDARAVLDRDLAKWFLALIHRRLRMAKIQPDVVRMAARFAEAFASTVEGASVRAALPTLRRSVGLCPRCGLPYGGAGDACPKCTLNITLRQDASDSDPEVTHS
jgi:hypothetical protein